MHLALLLAGTSLASASPLAGAWRFDVVVTTRAQVPLLGEAVVETHKVMLAQVAAGDDGSLVQSHEACGMYARSNKKIAQTWFPDSFIGAMHDQRYPISFDGDGEGGRLTARVEPVRLSWDPAVTGGALPQHGGEAGIVDGDSDGNPGVTVHVRAPLFGQVEVYIVQVSETSLDGRLVGPDLVTGRARLDRLEQRTIGASNRLFVSNVPLQPDNSSSWFRMSRVPAGTTCASLDAVSPPLPGTPAAEQAGSAAP